MSFLAGASPGPDGGMLGQIRGLMLGEYGQEIDRELGNRLLCQGYQEVVSVRGVSERFVTVPVFKVDNIYPPTKYLCASRPTSRSWKLGSYRLPCWVLNGATRGRQTGRRRRRRGMVLCGPPGQKVWKSSNVQLRRQGWQQPRLGSCSVGLVGQAMIARGEFERRGYSVLSPPHALSSSGKMPQIRLAAWPGHSPPSNARLAPSITANYLLAQVWEFEEDDRYYASTCDVLPQ